MVSQAYTLGRTTFSHSFVEFNVKVLDTGKLTPSRTLPECFFNGYHILFKREGLPLLPSFIGDKAIPSHSY